MSASPGSARDPVASTQPPVLALESLRLRRPSTSNALAALLRTRLIGGEYAPGEPIGESALARQLAVSRPTVREALQQLAHEGLLTHHLHRGMMVTALSGEDIVDIYRVRGVFEAAGIRAADRGGVSLAAPADAVEAFARALSTADPLAVVDADIALHASLVALTGSPRLVATHTGAVGQLRLALSRMDLASSDPDLQLEEHRALVRELQRGRADVALAVLRRHLDRAAAHLTAFVREVGAGDRTAT